MNLEQYIKSIPLDDREGAREAISVATGRSVSAVKSWSNGNRGIPVKYWEKIIKATDNKVTKDGLFKSVAA